MKLTWRLFWSALALLAAVVIAVMCVILFSPLLDGRDGRITAAKDLLTIVTVIPATVWALFVFTTGKQKEATARTLELFKSLYLDPEFGRLRSSMEFEYDSRICPVIDRAIARPEVEPSPADKETLRDLDLTLNHLEFLLHLEEQDQISAADRRALLGYWYDWLAEPRRSEIRLYIRRFGYAALSRLLAKREEKRLSAHKRNLVAFYGTLRSGCGGEQERALTKSAQALGPCRIQGKLLNEGAWPGLVKGDGIVKGDLYAMTQREIEAVDVHEGSDFSRQRVRLLDPAVEAWVYFYARADHGHVIPSGDWKQRDE
jgi:gamma-glutamylcyclotransferase (GGCT)/AIG2-like uncharacterized protein YtfP